MNAQCPVQAGVPVQQVLPPPVQQVQIGVPVQDPVIPSINVIVPSQLLGGDFLPAQTNILISEGTMFMMDGIMGTLVSQQGANAANQGQPNQGQPRRIIWSTGTIFYLNNNARTQCVINQGHQNDVLPLNTQVILPPETEIKWGNRLVRISPNESIANRTVSLA